MDMCRQASFLSKHHEVATFVQNNIPFVLEAKSSDNDQTEWIAVSINATKIINVYHPSPSALDTSQFPSVTPHFIISGDLYCHHENWGYPDSNPNRDRLEDWCSNNDLHKLFDPKQPPSFHSRTEVLTQI